MTQKDKIADLERENQRLRDLIEVARNDKVHFDIGEKTACGYDTYDVDTTDDIRQVPVKIAAAHGTE